LVGVIHANDLADFQVPQPTGSKADVYIPSVPQHSRGLSHRGAIVITSLLPGSKPSSRRRVAPEANAHQRLDIQGLRMAAVVLVVLSHLFHWPRGGFIGVDVFFVISGFLITGSLLHTLEKTGRISFSSFYRRRVRRIVPAATLVLLATCLSAYLIFGTARFESTAFDAVAAFAFVANWRFGIEGTDYFNASGPVSALQHYWSLSVEEQFYFVWPALIFVIGTLVARRSWSRRVQLAITVGVMGIVIIASFVYSVLDTESNPTWAYFSTLTRVWELGIGALLAISISYFKRIPDVARPCIAWFGLALILGGAFAITEDDGGFPAPWAAVPVLGTALVISAGVGGDHRFLKVLTNRVSTYFGDISYSLYLWHWPVIIMLEALMDRSGYYFAAALLLMGGLSVGAYHFVENPIRMSKWLQSAAEREDLRALKRSRWRLPSLRMGESSQRIALGSVALITAGLSAYALVPPTVVVNPYDKPTAEAATLTGRDRDIVDALAASEWPGNLTPALSDVTSARPPEDADGCGDTTNKSDRTCTYGSGDKVAFVAGDSVAITWLQPIRAVLESQGWTIRGVMKAGCPAVRIDPSNVTSEFADCAAHQRWVAQEVLRVKPDLVVVSETERLDVLTQTGPKGTAAAAKWQDAAAATYSELKSTGARLVVLAPTPQGKDPATCVTRTSVPVECVSLVSDNWHTTSTAEAAAAKSVGATYVNTLPWFCSAAEACPEFIGSVTVKRDHIHMTPEYANTITPDLAPVLLPGR
jgi:peptidoglycan/LPS O-acetylase OafA/YrhL